MGVAAAKDAPAASFEALTDNLSWLLARASHSLVTEMSAALAQTGISPRAHCVLSKASTGEHTQTDLAKAVGLDKTTMVVTIDELEAAGLAERRPATGDRRARIIAVTKAGKRKVEQANEIAGRLQAEVLDSLPAREREAFVRALARLVSDRLSANADCGGAVRRPRA
jgi:MarR family transcriptional regulator, transcriptional regulator for hemolysin